MQTREINKELWLVDFFKGIAILMVFLVHSAQRFELPAILTYIPRFSQMGCQIFFVLSAFTLCLSLEKKKYTYGSFVRRRISQIIPGYWCAILLYVILGWISLIVLKRNILGNDMSIASIIPNVFLLHGIIPTTANNLVVRGGWFVGTIVLFYYATPFVFKAFNWKNKKWRMTRKHLFPIIVAGGGSLFLIVLGMISEKLICRNNGFIYFSAVNQAGSYALGFSLYDIITRDEQRNIKYSELKCILLLIGTFSLFFSGYKHAFIFVPVLFSYAFLYVYVSAQKHMDKKAVSDSIIVRKIASWGKLSYMIYLTHSFVVYEGASILLKVMERFGINVPQYITYAMMLPAMLWGSFFIAKQYNRIVAYNRNLALSIWRGIVERSTRSIVSK